jgi:uncharacterized protein (TIRG00374 family)
MPRSQQLPDELHIEKLFEGENPSPWRILGWWFTGLLCLGAVLVVTLRFGELARFFEVLKGLKPEWIILAALLQALSYVSATAIWQQVLKASGHHIAFRSLYPLSIAQVFARQALPSSGLSGALLVVKGLANRGVRESVGFGCMLVGMVAFYIAYVMTVLISLAVLAIHHALSLWLAGMAVIVCLVAFSVPASILGLRYLNVHHHLPVFVKRRKFAQMILKVLDESPVHLLKNRSLLIKTSLLQISVYVIDAATLAVMLMAVGHPQSYEIVFSSFVMASVAATVLPVPLGLGAFEGACVALLHIFAVPLEPALVAVLLLRGFTFWLPMVPGLWLARKELHHPVRAYAN